ncbi:acyl carrier protein [Candidatus Woesearchaeota archaeon]|nr:acyl carrier protein [Candidatus Woesearchaeota archaeon]
MEKLKDLIARVLGVDKKEINDDSSPDTIASWDSFNGLMLVSEVERNFNIKFSMDAVMNINSYKAIKNALKKQGIKKGID